jgi:hypothetical protein
VKKFILATTLVCFTITCIAAQEQAISTPAKASHNTSIKKHTALFKQTSLLDPIQQIILGYLDSWDPVDHESGIAIAFSHDETTKAIQNENGTAVISKNNQILHVLPKTSNNVNVFCQIALSPNGHYCARAFMDNKDRLKTSPDSKIEPDNSKSYIEIWNTITGELIETIFFNSYFNQIHLLKFSPDDAYLISLDRTGLLVINSKDWSHKFTKWPETPELDHMRRHGFCAAVSFEMPYISIYIHPIQRLSLNLNIPPNCIITYNTSESEIVSTKKYLENFVCRKAIILPITKKLVLLEASYYHFSSGSNMAYFDDKNLLHDKVDVRCPSLKADDGSKPVITFSSNEEYFASAQMNHIAIWNAQTKRVIQEIIIDKAFSTTFNNSWSNFIFKENALTFAKKSALLLIQTQSYIYSYINLKLLLKEEIANDNSLAQK